MGKLKTTINVHLLILEVQKYPCLYDTEDPSRRDAEKVHNMWREVGGVLKALVLLLSSIIGFVVGISINQSINQTSTAPISSMKPGSVAQQPNQRSTAKSRKQFRNINRPWGVTVSMGKRPNQGDVSIFLGRSN